MAGFFQDFLQGTKEGFFGTLNLRDYTHASKTFRTNGYANSPKFKWLFHVYFEVNPLLTGAAKLIPESELPGLLVKTISLPKYSISTAEVNQYNRRRYVQTKLTYDPVQITFHDDNGGTIRNLWYSYFSYYYNDSNQPTGSNISNAIGKLNQRNLYSPDISGVDQWGLNGDLVELPCNISTSKPSFFSSIKIYGFNQHNYSLYELVNPIIERFDHDTYSYSETGTMENRMTIKYETVKYSQGAMNGANPGGVVTGFGDSNYYDTQLSPIARPGANKTIMGPGGLVDAGIGFVDKLATGLNALETGNYGGALAAGLGAVQIAGTTKNTFKNPQNVLQTAKSELVTGAFNLTQNPSQVRTLFNFPSTKL